MTISARLSAFFPDFSVLHPLRWMLAAAAVATLAAPDIADARAARPGAFDGTWNVTFTPRGRELPCHQHRAVQRPRDPCFFGRRRQGHRRGQPQGQRHRQDHRWRLMGGRPRPARRQFGRRPLGRAHHRRPLQRGLAGDPELGSSRVPDAVQRYSAAPQSRDPRRITAARWAPALQRSAKQRCTASGARNRPSQKNRPARSSDGPVCCLLNFERAVVLPISAAPEPSRPDGPRNAHPARPWRIRRHRP